MSEPAVLQTGPETYRVLLGDGRILEATLAHHTRRGLGLTQVPPLTVARELVRFLIERGALEDPGPDDGIVPLGALAGRYPEFVDELRSRLL